MADPFPTFDESWHRVSDRQVRLRTGVQVTRQIFRGRPWHVLKDPFSNQYFRLRPVAWDFICRLEANRTVGDAWEDVLNAHPDDAPGQSEVIHLLSQLYRLNLLQSDLPGDTAVLFERLETRERKETIQKWTHVLFLRIPLFNPDELLKRTLPMVKWLISWLGFVIWLAAISYGIKLLFDNWGAFADQTQSVLSKNNLPWLYVAIIVTKLVHEFGHGYFCRKFGGEVPIMGVMLLIFNPLPYVDASSSWTFRNRWHRVLVAAAGMIVELFLAAIAMWVWANTSAGPINSLAYNMVFMASVATLLFNLNPLLRFDGYHILSDLTETPNLQGRATKLMQFWFERYFFGIHTAVAPTDSKKERFWLTVYFVSTFIYRIFLFAGIILFIADRFLIVGIILAVLGAVVWGIMPVVKVMKYLVAAPQIARKRPRAIAVVVGMIAAILGFLCLVPMPAHFRASGVLRANQFSIVFTGSTGQLAEQVTPSGSFAKKGDVLLRFENKEFDEQYFITTSEREANAVRRKDAEQSDLARFVALKDFTAAIDEQVVQIGEEIEKLEVIAAHDGRWISPVLHERHDTWVPKGTEVGQLIDGKEFYFSAVVPQSQTSQLFGDQVQRSSVKLAGQEDQTLQIISLEAIPADRAFLPSASLGLFGGGDIEVASDDGSGRRAREPIFEVRAKLERPDSVEFIHGNNGRARFALPNEPYMSQWIRQLRQLFQRRYQI